LIFSPKFCLHFSSPSIYAKCIAISFSLM
jgi:hypothetical protein